MLEAITGGGRLKGKARKQAKLAPSEPATALPTKYVIRIRGFTVLARYILEKTIAVPLLFQSTLNRAISARAGFGAKLTEHGSGPDLAADAKHENFVCAETYDTLPNRFAGLDIYQPSAAFLAAPDIQRPTKPDADPVDYVAEISTSLEDTITTLWMLMDDMNTARAFLQSIWKNASNSTVLLTADEVQRIIELCAYETSTDEETGQTLLCQIEDEKKVREKKKLRHEFESGSKLSKSGRGEPRVSFSVMMDLLVNALQAETVEFPFPYVMMHRRCWQLFRHACETEDHVANLGPLKAAAQAVNEIQDSGFDRAIVEDVLKGVMSIGVGTID
ncbi:hypothetical protein CCM_05739 [Cordyceps militaris CM01]|uniref:DUF6604 domain-containing protein n=1 Tax=Cordyceps militaris (strain CM01) TaxID=983644 RepID=G3JH25_CORMM|nr:uncharacterized protein CCM_05739 [Cordyceps militaris CM01]EGX91581.1 hypothetical protein CCM_05739 [Cordyceps militaris CM01]